MYAAGFEKHRATRELDENNFLSIESNRILLSILQSDGNRLSLLPAVCFNSEQSYGNISQVNSRFQSCSRVFPKSKLPGQQESNTKC